MSQAEFAPLEQREWLSPKQLAAIFGLNEESAYRWRREIIPEFHPKTHKRLVRFAGMKRIFFHVDCVPLVEDKFAAAHD